MEDHRTLLLSWPGDIDLPDERYAPYRNSEWGYRLTPALMGWIAYFGMILKGNEGFVMRKRVDWTQQKTVTFANPVSNPASAPIAGESLVYLSGGSGSPLARLLPPHLWLVAPANISGELVEPDRDREEQEFACETGQRARASFYFFSFLPHDPLREAT